MASEQELIAAAKDGSHSAFAALVERYQDGLYRFLRVRCASVGDAEDALQDTFVGAWRYLASYDPRWRFGTWLYAIAVREAAGRPAASEPLAHEPADPGADPLDDCIEDDGRRNIWLTAREKLTPDGHTVLWLHYAEDMAVKDVARAMGRSVSWVKVNLYRARRRLARELGTEDAT
jgi:RNA polymerase sigma-70 factor (ECF subfamily)